uniref:Uncharacterized protein n=1 Tax=Cyprinus carpio carpio TaxID=630221 RepID=A0A9J8AGS7_CYPCA
MTHGQNCIWSVLFPQAYSTMSSSLNTLTLLAFFHVLDIWVVVRGMSVKDEFCLSKMVYCAANNISMRQAISNATGSWDRTVRVWKLLEEKEPVTLQGHQGNMTCVCFSFSGMLASGSWDGTVRVWLPMRHACLFVLGGCERVWVRSLAFSRDGLVLASTAEGDMVRIWDMTTGVCLKRLQVIENL